MKSTVSRRTFTQLSASAVFAAPAIQVLGANEQIAVGLIGCSGRANDLVRTFLKAGAEFKAVCDVDQTRLAHGRDIAGGNDVAAYTDYRQLLERKDMDAVIIATPPHWHPLQFIDACKAGFDIYCEKPIGVTIYEGQMMVKAARKYDRVNQCGTQSHSAPLYREAMQLLHEGYIGQITKAKSWSLRNNHPQGIGQEVITNPPDELDWDFWLGPLPNTPYSRQRCHGTFRWFWDTEGGWMTDWGTHQLDIIQWGIRQDYPESVSAEGGKFFFTDCSQMPDTMDAVFRFKDCLVQFELRSANAHDPAHQPTMPTWDGYGIEFYGSSGTMFLDRDRLIVWPEKEPFGKATAAIDKTGDHREMNDNHVQDFLTNIKSRKRCVCDVEVCHRASSTSHLGNIAYRTGERLVWDGVEEKITNHPELNSWLQREYRQPWKLEV
jgi:predicted dehydrogenase